MATERYELDPETKRRNLKTALILMVIIACSVALSYFGRQLMIPALFKVG